MSSPGLVIVKKVENPHHPLFNSSGHETHSPFEFVLLNEPERPRWSLHYDIAWWKRQSEHFRQIANLWLEAHRDIVEARPLSDFRVPHPPPDPGASSLFESFRSVYFDSFSCTQWMHGLGGPCVHVELKENDCHVILEAQRLYQLTGRISNAHTLDDLLPDTLRMIREAFRHIQQTTGRRRLFAKVAEASAKDAQSKVESVDQLWATMCSSQRMYTFLEASVKYGHPACLLLQPYNDAINSTNEYRVIVTGGKVVAISQQKFYNGEQLAHTDHERVVSNIVRWWDQEKHSFGYKTSDVVADVYVDGDLNVHLIECNPGGPWTHTGSALFHWIEDRLILADKFYWPIVIFRHV